MVQLLTKEILSFNLINLVEHGIETCQIKMKKTPHLLIKEIEPTSQNQKKRQIPQKIQALTCYQIMTTLKMPTKKAQEKNLILKNKVCDTYRLSKKEN